MSHYLRVHVAILAILIVCGPMLPAARGVEIYSEGLAFPEMLVQAPEGFDTIGGDSLVPDPGVQKLWRVPAGGGDPVEFADLKPFGDQIQPMGGVFLPETGWGNQSGRFLTVASNPGGIPPGENLGPPAETFTSAADGTTEHLVTLSGLDSGAPFMISPRVARFVPDEFGTGADAGRLSITDLQGGYILLDPLVQPDDSLLFGYEVLYDHNASGIAGTSLDINPWGAAFAPDGFGSVGGTVLLSDTRSGRIISLNESGDVTLFSTISLLAGQTGLRNIEFGPADFLLDALGIAGQQLFVSVTATSGYQAGICGDVLALDGSGNVLASLRTFNDLDKFDPRGMFFTEDGQLLVCDTSDPIVLSLPEDFEPGRMGNVVPEPSSLVGCTLLAVAALACGLWKRRRKR